jgi:uracil-DNA glycosylase family 4
METQPAEPSAAEPPHDCPLCPRLVAYRAANRAAHADWWNAPVPGWGDRLGWLAIVGLAPGVTGANRTGRPFTGDHAGLLLYATLARFGLSRGTFDARPDDGLTLDGAFITNAVRCVPPENKPVPAEIHACRPFLTAQLAALPRLEVVLALGAIAHQSAVKALGGKLPKVPFAHGAVHRLHTGVTLVDSYHCSRYNTNTGRLTPAMFEAAFAAAVAARRPVVDRTALA